MWALSRDGGIQWASSDVAPIKWGPSSVANGVVYSADDSGFLTMRESSTGAVIGKVALPAGTYGGVSIAGGYVFVAIGTQTSTGYLVAYRADPPSAAAVK